MSSAASRSYQITYTHCLRYYIQLDTNFFSERVSAVCNSLTPTCATPYRFQRRIS